MWVKRNYQALLWESETGVASKESSIESPQKVKNSTTKAREAAQQLQTFAALPEDQSLLPDTYITTCNPSSEEFDMF